MTEAVRPRLTKAELKFIAESLRLRETYSSQQQDNISKTQAEIRDLKEQFCQCGDYHILNKVKEEQQRLVKGRQQNYYKQTWVARVLAIRFEALLNGDIKHSGREHHFGSNQNRPNIQLEPRTTEA